MAVAPLSAFSAQQGAAEMKIHCDGGGYSQDEKNPPIPYSILWLSAAIRRDSRTFDRAISDQFSPRIPLFHVGRGPKDFSRGIYHVYLYFGAPDGDMTCRIELPKHSRTLSNFVIAKSPRTDTSCRSLVMAIASGVHQ